MKLKNNENNIHLIVVLLLVLLIQSIFIPNVNVNRQVIGNKENITAQNQSDSHISVGKYILRQDIFKSQGLVGNSEHFVPYGHTAWTNLLGPAVDFYAGDIDKDGHTEIIAGSRWSIVIYRYYYENGTLNYLSWLKRECRQIKATDFDGDGVMEVVISGDTQPLSVYRFNGTHLISMFYSTSLPGGGEGFAFSDLDNDGNKEIVAGSEQGPVKIFEYDPNTDSFTIMWDSTDNVNLDGSRSIVVDDIDGDSLTELVISGFWNTTVLEYNAGTFSVEKVFPWGSWKIEVIDIDNDGKKEIINGGIDIYEIPGADSYNDTSEFSFVASICAFEYGDLIDNGQKELIAVSGDTKQVFLIVYMGPDTYDVFPISQEIPGLQHNAQITLADVTHNGFDELIISDKFCSFSIMKYNGYTNNLETIASALPELKGIPQDIIIENIDGTGNDEFVVATNYGLYILKNAEHKPVYWQEFFVNESIKKVILYDVDLDTKKELVMVTDYTIKVFDILVSTGQENITLSLKSSLVFTTPIGDALITRAFNFSSSPEFFVYSYPSSSNQYLTNITIYTYNITDNTFTTKQNLSIPLVDSFDKPNIITQASDGSSTMLITLTKYGLYSLIKYNATTESFYLDTQVDLLSGYNYVTSYCLADIDNDHSSELILAFDYNDGARTTASLLLLDQLNSTPTEVSNMNISAYYEITDVSHLTLAGQEYFLLTGIDYGWGYSGGGLWALTLESNGSFVVRDFYEQDPYSSSHPYLIQGATTLDIKRANDNIALMIVGARDYAVYTFYYSLTGEEGVLFLHPQWPMFKNNPMRTGLAPYSTKNNKGIILWTFDIGNLSSSSPVIGGDGTIYIGADDGYVYAIWPNGTMRWKFKTEGYVKAPPALGNDGTIYVGTHDAFLYAIWPNGTLRWKFQTGFLIDSAPAISADGTIYISTLDGYIYAIWPNGTLRWKFQTGETIDSSPAIGDDGTIYIGSYGNCVYAIWPNGTLRWKFETNGLVRSTPSIGSDGTIYVGSFDNCVYAIWPNGTLRWKFQTNGNVLSSPSIGSDGTIYVGSFDSYVYAIWPNGTMRWKFKTGDVIPTSPAISKENIIYIGSLDTSIYAIWPNGTLKWAITQNYAITTSPAIDKVGNIYIVAVNYLYKIGTDNPPVIIEVWHSPQTPSATEDLTIFAQVWDDCGIDAVYLLYSFDEGGTWLNGTMRPSSSANAIYETTVTMQDVVGTFYYKIYVKDTSGNSVESDVYKVTVVAQGVSNPNPNPPPENSNTGTNNNESQQLPSNNYIFMGVAGLAILVISTAFVVKSRKQRPQKPKSKTLKREEDLENKKSEVSPITETQRRVLSVTKRNYDEMYAEFVAGNMNIGYIDKVNRAIRKDFGNWLADKLIAEGKHDIAKDILIKIGEYEKAIPVIISLAIYNKVQENRKRAKELYKLAADLYRKIGDNQKAREIEKELSKL